MRLPRFFAMLPRVTRGLIVACFIVFLLQLAAGHGAFDAFALWPMGAGDYETISNDVQTFMPWQLVTYSFLHGDFGHLFFNMLAVLMFGAQLEHLWGERKFAIYWFACVAGAGACQLAMATWLLSNQNILVSAIGASGGVYGLIIAFGMKFPDQKVAIFPLPMLITARTLAIVFAVVAVFYGVFASNDGVAHFAHLGGLVTGWLLVRYWAGKPPFGKGGKKKPPYIRRVH
jgi:membrane associated rhomboid family serine protease